MTPGALDPAGLPLFFVLRTPLLSFDEFLTWSEGSLAAVPDGAPDRLQAALEEDRTRQRARLRELVAQADVREAIFLASPDLESAIEHWRGDPYAEKSQRAERALVKYLSRMSGRATPFGLFAGGCVGTPGARTRLLLAPRETSRRHSRLDMDYLFVLAEAVAQDRFLRKGLTFRPNSTLYRAGERFRYVESRIDGQERTYHLVAVEANEYIERTLERASRGSRLDHLSSALEAEGVNEEEARSFVEELADSQILTPDTGMAITGREPGSLMAETLGALAETRAIGVRLDQVNRQLEAIDAAGLGAAPGRYRELANLLVDLPAKPEISRLVQVDLTKTSADLSLGEDVAAEIRRGLEFLHRVTPPWKSALPAFREAFSERYEEREVPLVEALDEERGIGFPAFLEEDDAHAPLLAGVRFPLETADGEKWGARESFLFRKLSRTLARGEEELVLDDADAEALENKERKPMPGAFGVMVRVVAESDEALDQGDFRVLVESAGGPSGALFLGRFCHGDEDLRRFVAEHLKAEAELQPDAIFAELVHLPDGRTGNVVSRPSFHEYEIPFLGGSGAPQGRQIPVSDLLVSVRGDEIRLRSIRLGRRVLPRLTTAHNFAHYGLGVYRFLCSLQAQTTVGGLVWRWGPLSSAPFLPRVRYGRIILAPAQWNLETKEFRKLGKRLDAGGFETIRRWRREHRIPRFVMVGENQEIPIDLESVLSLETFLSLVRESETAEIREMIPGPEALCARGPEGRYVHELMIPFVGASPAPARPFEPFPRPAKRTFLPGSEWLYAKLYGGNVALDHALVRSVGPLVESVLASGDVDSWYFVRYADPRPHLRVRFHGDSRRLREQVWPVLLRTAEELKAAGEVWRVQLDTYEREVERYGGARGIELAERVFHVDSDAVLSILGMLEEGEAGQDERWRMALLGCDALLDDLGLPFDDKRAFVRHARTAYGLGRLEDSELRRTLGERFRQESRDLRLLFEKKNLESSPLRPGLDVLADRSRRLAPLLTALRAADSAGELERPICVVGGSFVHMFLNRMFLAGHRRQELVAYELLDRLYGAIAAIARSRSGTSNT